ncbi:hypothetical protein E0Z10_g11001 [Xylaria hypoxylon]|uniref:Heterokaryon incompatibility domain-containing protein n=1 Tax=Xylaria hypoxylon TaxID=37992 RepID=A0A4Z0Y635_9PEZI|nr:hypothetical protein E0Z10_g11001 [Xylaria hypoxylon]
MSPLRLVNVMDGNMIRLERTDDKSHRYAALSYCWGGSKALEDAKTMGDNIDVRMSGFRLDELPRTLKDAIILTRRLNIQYIWIDAICIVQDCEHEWNNEARKMMHYYGHALVAIVPVDSKSGDCGIDVGNNPPLCCKIPRSWSAISRIGDVLTSSNHSSDEETSEWERRGWTYQEKLNSSRILFVFRHRLRLKCREGFFDTLTHWTDWKSIARESRPTFLPTGSFGMEQKDLWTYWYCIVQFYTTRRLTEPRDRSIALSGITQAFEQGSGCEIIAGMFKDTILLDIVSWTSPDTSPRHSRARQSPTGCPRVHLASLPVCSNCGLPECGKCSDRTDSQESSIPSWTWLATNWSEDGKVVNLAATRVLQESSAKLLSISSVEPFQLRISGAMLSSDEILRHLYYHRKYSRKTYCGGRGFGTAFLDSHGDIYGCMCETDHITSDCKAYDVIGSLSPAASALFMGTHYHNSMPPNGDDIWHFILIQPTEPLGGQEKPLQYRRIGTMHIPGNLFDEGLKNNLKNREWGIIILV